MFPFAALRSTYCQYKEDTDAVASWLAKTARRCGYTGQLLDNLKEEVSATVEQPQPQRLKGKARKKAKQEAAQTNATPSRKRYCLVSTSAFITLAKYIAESKNPTAETSSTFVQALDRAISLRRKFSRSLANVNAIAGQSIKSHVHFIGVLEEVKKILGNLKTSPVKEDIASKLTNSFVGLAVQEPSESTPDTSTTDATTEPEPEFKADQFEDPNELYIAFKLLVEDVHNIRKAVNQIWAAYKGGKYRTVAAALATNTAIDFARGLEQDISAVIEKYGGFEKIYCGWWQGICKTQGHDANDRQQPEDDLNFRTYEDADTVMFPTFLLLKSFLPVVQEDPNLIPIAKPGHFGQIDYTRDWNSKKPREKYASDKALLLSVLGSLTAVIRIAGDDQKGFPAEDELMRGLRIAIKTRKIHLWNVLSAQILLDIHHILRKDVFRPFQELYAVGQHLSQSIDKNLDRDTIHPNWPKENDEGLKYIRALVQDWVLEDGVQKTLQRSGCPAPPEQHHYFKNNPVFCGLFQYSLQMRFHVVSINFVNAWGSILYARHLYNALRQEKLLTNKWEDMELLSMLQPDSVAFGGKAPKDRQNFLKRYAIMNGVSAASFSPDARKSFQKSGSGMKGIQYQADLARVFMHRYCESSGRVDYTPDEVKKIMEKTITYEKDGDTSDIGELPWKQQGTLMSFSKPEKEQLRDRSRVRALRRLTIPELLDKLADALMGETSTHEFHFDYLYMHFTSWTMLTVVRRICDPQFQQMFGPQYLAHDYELPGLVGYLLIALLKVGQFENDICGHPVTGQPTSLIMARTGGLWDHSTKSMGNLISEHLKGSYALYYRIE